MVTFTRSPDSRYLRVATVSFQPNKKLTDRVERAAVALLARDGRFTYPTLLRELGIISAQDLDAWRGGCVPFLEKVTRANLTKLARIQTAVRRVARALGLKRRIVHAPRGRRYSKSGHPSVEEEYGAVYTRRVRASLIPPDVAAAIHRCWPDGLVDEFATDESYFHEIHARLERDLQNIRGASLRWRTTDSQPDARSDDDDELRLPDEWQSYYVFFLITRVTKTARRRSPMWSRSSTAKRLSGESTPTNTIERS